jgi:uncharacterized protein YdhG (YjbR/CyaY superfamily)
VKIMDRIIRWFCRSAEADAMREQAAQVRRHTEAVHNEATQRIASQDERLDRLQRRARIYFRDYDDHPGIHGRGSSGDGGHASGGAGR